MAEPQPGALVVAVVGAESTGKTALAQALAEHLARATGRRCTWVPETLREWCDVQGRTPRRDEQAAIAAHHSARIRRAAAAHEVVVADTTALMTAVYSRVIFDDDSLDSLAVAAHRLCRLTLLTGLDLPWVADGLQRDGPHVRVPVDTVLRQLMHSHGIGYSLVLGQGPQRLQSALAAVAPLMPAAPGLTAGEAGSTGAADEPLQRWRQLCERCSDPACEHASWLAR